eukprot:49577-Eustigmatos_ZCMA.PRE.1
MPTFASLHAEQARVHNADVADVLNLPSSWTVQASHGHDEPLPSRVHTWLTPHNVDDLPFYD